MKIVVDEMPNTPEECPYSMWGSRDGEIVRVCMYNKKNTVWANECFSTRNCPYFTDFGNEMRSRE